MRPDEQTPNDGKFELLAAQTAQEATAAMTRSEISAQVDIANKYPRSITTFTKRATTMATMDVETAESCLFRRPVGKKNGKEEFAEGMSIRMAEIVGACYGNLRVYATIVSQTKRQVVARGMAIDLETNFASSSEVIESTVKSDGTPFSERMAIVVAKAALSKARRDATFQVVPRALARPVETAVRQLLVGDATTIQKRRERVTGWIKALGIDQARVYAAIGVKGVEDLGLDELETLQGIKTAIKENETTIDEAFPELAKGKPDGGKAAEPKADTAKTDGTTAKAPTTATKEPEKPPFTPEIVKTPPVETAGTAKTAGNTPPPDAGKALTPSAGGSGEELVKTLIRANVSETAFAKFLKDHGFTPDNENPATFDECLSLLTPKALNGLVKNVADIIADCQTKVEAEDDIPFESGPAPSSPSGSSTSNAPEPTAKPVETVQPSPAGETLVQTIRRKAKEQGVSEADVLDWGKKKKKIPAGAESLDAVAEVAPTMLNFIVNSFSKIVADIKGAK